MVELVKLIASFQAHPQEITRYSSDQLAQSAVASASELQLVVRPIVSSVEPRVKLHPRLRSFN